MIEKGSHFCNETVKVSNESESERIMNQLRMTNFMN